MSAIGSSGWSSVAEVEVAENKHDASTVAEDKKAVLRKVTWLILPILNNYFLWSNNFKNLKNVVVPHPFATYKFTEISILKIEPFHIPENQSPE